MFVEAVAELVEFEMGEVGEGSRPAFDFDDDGVHGIAESDAEGGDGNGIDGLGDVGEPIAEIEGT